MFVRLERVTMCGPWAYDSYLKYAAVFPEIADILQTHGVKAKVRNNKDNNGLVVKVTLPDRAGELNDGERDNWSIDFGSEVIELDIPVENRDAEAIATALLKAIGK
jgi:hypothetical protein